MRCFIQHPVKTGTPSEEPTHEEAGLRTPAAPRCSRRDRTYIPHQAPARTGRPSRTRSLGDPA